MMAKHRDPKSAARPVIAGQVEIAWKCPAVRLRSGQHVVLVEWLEHAVEGLALLGNRRLLGDLVIGAMEIVDVLRDDFAVGILPGASPDAIAGVDGATGKVGAEVGAPSVLSCPRRLGQRLAVLVSARQAAKVSALAGTDAGDEEGSDLLT
jgi:hypothetical protein